MSSVRKVPQTSMKGTLFLIPLTLSMPIFNNKFHQTQAVEYLKLWYTSYSTICIRNGVTRWKFLLKIVILKSVHKARNISPNKD